MSALRNHTNKKRPPGLFFYVPYKIILGLGLTYQFLGRAIFHWFTLNKFRWIVLL